jgi:ABC-type sugar transport system ATPase subunit
MSQLAVRMQGMSKSFPGVVALDGVDLEVRRGEVMALVGENGAGKSTLLKILAGMYTPDGGVVEVEGEEVSLGSPRLSQKHGIAVIHQELNLARHLSVAENIWVGREPRTRLGLADFASMRAKSRKLTADLGINLDPDSLVGTLSIARQQMVEIAKALSYDAAIVVMDEPTSSVTDDEVDVLLTIVRRLRERGVAVIYVSHRLREIFDIADRITVLRDGKNVGEILETAASSPAEVVNLMVGRDIDEVFGHREQPVEDVPPVLAVRRLRSGVRVKDVSFMVRPGEIVGLAGLVGAGRSESARAIFGMEPVDGGEILLDGAPATWSGPAGAIAAGVALVPEDRKASALFLDLPVAVNIASASDDQVSRLGWLRGGAERRITRRFADRLNLRANALPHPVRALSGGNQQKAVLARWLATAPRVLLLDEPTRGVDMGAKEEIYGLMRAIAATGVAILMISSELNEVLGMSDRVVVLREGRVSGELSGDDITERAVMSLATGVHERGVA